MSQAPAVSPVDEVIEFFAHGPSREEIATFELSGAAQDRLRVLLRKNAAGALIAEEEHELDKMVLLDDIISLIRVRAQRPTATPPSSSNPTHA